jgi:hypothetical protein
VNADCGDVVRAFQGNVTLLDVGLNLTVVSKARMLNLMFGTLFDPTTFESEVI